MIVVAWVHYSRQFTGCIRDHGPGFITLDNFLAPWLWVHNCGQFTGCIRDHSPGFITVDSLLAVLGTMTLYKYKNEQTNTILEGLSLILGLGPTVESWYKC